MSIHFKRVQDMGNIAFLSNSRETFDSIPAEAFKQWNIFFVSPDDSSLLVSRINTASMVIVDTYSLGMDFLQLMLHRNKFQCPVLVLDHYTEELFINNILAKGAKGYLLVHSFDEELGAAVSELLNGNNYVSPLLESYKGNAYLLK